MKNPSFNDAIEEVLEKDRRYTEPAYYFIREALDHTIQLLSKPVDGPGRHVSGQELLDGIRQFALNEFGPITKTVLNRWGVVECRDFGNLVFNLVEQGILGKTDDDRLEDFTEGYDFYDAFRRPYLPEEEWNGSVVPDTSPDTPSDTTPDATPDTPSDTTQSNDTK